MGHQYSLRGAISLSEETKPKFDIKKYWPMIKDSVIFDLNMVNPEEIEKFDLTRGLYSFKVEVRLKVPPSEELLYE
jgi:hypothetical protein